jgi:hypothetical protein
MASFGVRDVGVGVNKSPSVEFFHPGLRLAAQQPYAPVAAIAAIMPT